MNKVEIWSILDKKTGGLITIVYSEGEAERIIDKNDNLYYKKN